MLNVSKIIRLDIILLKLAHVVSFFLFTSVTLVSLSTFLDIRVEDVSNLGGGWKVRDLSESRIYNKDRKTKEFPENRLDSLLEWDRRPKRA